MSTVRKDFYYAASRHAGADGTCLVFKDVPFNPAVLLNAKTVFLYGDDFQEDASLAPNQCHAASMTYWADHFSHALQAVRPFTGINDIVAILAAPSVRGPDSKYMKTIVTQGVGINMARCEGLSNRQEFAALSSGDFQTYVELVQENHDRAIDHLLLL